MTKPSEIQRYFVLIQLFFIKSFLGDKLNARELLRTIAPKARPPHLPPGFSSLDTISTDKFRYKITKKNIVVTANLDYEENIQLFPGQITVSDIKLKFVHDKESGNKDWQALVTGMLYCLIPK